MTNNSRNTDIASDTELRQSNSLLGSEELGAGAGGVGGVGVGVEAGSDLSNTIAASLSGINFACTVVVGNWSRFDRLNSGPLQDCS